MTAKKLGLSEEEIKPQPKPLRQAWEAYQEAKKESQVAKRRLLEETIARGEDQLEVYRRQPGSFEREMRAKHAENLAKAPVQAPQPVQEEENEMEEDEEETEAGDEGEGTKDTPIEVAADVGAPWRCLNRWKGSRSLEWKGRLLEHCRRNEEI